MKTGAPEEIERFSKFERQKLVELLSTNQDLLNHMHDKMFNNMRDDKEREQALLSQMTLSEHFSGARLDPEPLAQLEDPLEAIQRSTELRHQMHH